MKQKDKDFFNGLIDKLKDMTPEEFYEKHEKPHQKEIDEIFKKDYTNNTGFYIIHPETGEPL